MKKQLFSLFILVNLAFMACSQNNYSTWNGKKWEQIDGSGKLVILDPPVDIFNAVEVNNVNVNVETGAENYSLHISVDDNLKDYFKWKVESGILKLFFDLSGGKYSRWISSSNTVVTIKAPAFEKLVNHGNSNVSVNLKGQSS
jgi:Putative auto-transporter adhesin, head GIN domain